MQCISTNPINTPKHAPFGMNGHEPGSGLANSDTGYPGTIGWKMEVAGSGR